MDEITKYRITGAAIWLLMLIILVPSWYNNPVEDWHHQAWSAQVVLADEDDELLEENLLPAQKPEVKTEQVAQPAIQPALKPEPKQEPKIEPKPAAKPAPKPEIKPVPKEQVVSKPADKPKLATESKQVKQPNQTKPATEWYVRVATYESIRTANRTLGMLEQDYQVTIGDFSLGDKKMYTVRVGPYSTEAEALAVKQVLDKNLNTKSVIIKR